MRRFAWLTAALLATAGCTLQDMTPSSTSKPASAGAAPQGWQQSGTMKVGGQEVPVYTEIYRGEGENPHRMALNPATGKVQPFFRDEVGHLIWQPDPMEPSGQ